jgi:hypothetical protein
MLSPPFIHFEESAMDILPAAEVLAISYPVLDALLAGARDRVKELGKGLTARAIDGLQAFWQRVITVRPEAKDLIEQRPARLEHADALRALITEVMETDEVLRRRSAELHQEIKVAAQTLGSHQVVTGNDNLIVGGNVHGGITMHKH